MAFLTTITRLNEQAAIAAEFRAKQAMRAGVFGRINYSESNDRANAGIDIERSRVDTGRINPAQN